MKDINGNDLQQPYYDLAVMRMEQQKGSKWADIYGKKYAESGRLDDAFEWDDSPEKYPFWDYVDYNRHPQIPQSSLDELEAWRKSKGVNSLKEGLEKIKQLPIDERRKIADDIQSELPADNTDWIDEYKRLEKELDFVKKSYADHLSKHQEILDAFYDSAKLTPNRNFIAECAMRAMQGMLSNPSFMDEQDGYYTLKHEHTVASLAFDYAEAMAAEGKKRGYIN